jgi:hypothetical protein
MSYAASDLKVQILELLLLRGPEEAPIFLFSILLPEFFLFPCFVIKIIKWSGKEWGSGEEISR